MRAGEDAGLLLGQIGAIEIALSRGGFPVDSDRLLLVGRRQRVDERMLRSDDEVGDAVEGVGTCRVDAEDIPTGLEGESRGAAGRLPGGESCVSRARGGDREVDLGAGAPADPVGLELLDARRPVEGLELLLQSIGVGGDPQHPLAQRDADDRMAAALAHPPDHLLVGEHRAQGRAPVDRRLRLVGEAVEIAVGGDGRVPPGRDVGGDRQLGDRAPLLLPGVEPGVEEDEKDPLRPADVFRIGGREDAVPVVAEAEHLQLTGEVGDVALGALPRRGAGADRILLGGEPEGIEAHRVDDARAPHPLEAGDDIGGGVALRVPDVEPLTTGVGEHVEDVRLPSPGEAGGRERVVRLPPGLPLGLDPGGLVAGHDGFRGEGAGGWLSCENSADSNGPQASEQSGPKAPPRIDACNPRQHPPRRPRRPRPRRSSAPAPIPAAAPHSLGPSSGPADWQGGG